MKRLVKGVINNLLVEYIECIENSYYDRKQTVIRKKTSFFINNEEFYTLDDIEIIDGGIYIFYADNENQIALFGKEQITEDLEITSKNKIIQQKKEMKESYLMIFLSVLLFSIIGNFIYNHDESIPIVLIILAYIPLILSFLLSIIGYLVIIEEKKNLKETEDSIKKQKEEIHNFNNQTADIILLKEKDILIKNEV
ncbi:hypothetical protein ACTOJ1_000565 [Shigella flexneri]